MSGLKGDSPCALDTTAQDHRNFKYTSFNHLILHASESWLLPTELWPEHLDKTSRSLPQVVFRDSDLRSWESQDMKEQQELLESHLLHEGRFSLCRRMKGILCTAMPDPRFGTSSRWAVSVLYSPPHQRQLLPHHLPPAPRRLTTHRQSSQTKKVWYPSSDKKVWYPSSAVSLV